MKSCRKKKFFNEEDVFAMIHIFEVLFVLKAKTTLKPLLLLDKIKLMSNDGYKTKAIIRTGIGSERPLHPQYQHVGDFTDSVKKMCSNIEVIRLDETKNIFPAYEKALNREDGKCTIVVEYGDYYNEK